MLRGQEILVDTNQKCLTASRAAQEPPPRHSAHAQPLALSFPPLLSPRRLFVCISSNDIPLPAATPPAPLLCHPSQDLPAASVALKSFARLQKPRETCQNSRAISYYERPGPAKPRQRSCITTYHDPASGAALLLASQWEER